MTAVLNLAPWRRLGEETAGDALRSGPSEEGVVTDDEVVGMFDHLGLWGDDQCDAQLAAAGIAPTQEHRDAVRVAVREGYTQRMERRG